MQDYQQCHSGGGGYGSGGDDVTVCQCLLYMMYMNVCVWYQLPALSTLKYNQALNNPDMDKFRGWYQLPQRSEHVLPASRHIPVSIPPSSQERDMSTRQPHLIPTTSGTSGSVPREIKYIATPGPLSSEMKYPDVHAITHDGTTRASYRRARIDSVGTGSRAAMLARPTTVDRDLYRTQALAAYFRAGGSLRRKSSDTGRPREAIFGNRHAGMRPGDYSEKRDWTDASELEYRVWKTLVFVHTHMRTHTETMS